jgi:hypothetical protein
MLQRKIGVFLLFCLILLTFGCADERPAEEEVEQVSKYSETIHEDYILTQMDEDIVFLYLKQPQNIEARYGISSVQLIRIRALQAALKVARHKYFDNEDIFMTQWSVNEAVTSSNEYLLIRKETIKDGLESIDTSKIKIPKGRDEE